jgi:regulator of RNase E activity RraA
MYNWPVRLLCLLLLLSAMAPGQIFRLSREQMVRYTPLNPFERFADGRPKVPDDLLERLKKLSLEDAWSVLQAKGYSNQFVVGFKVLHPGKKLVGRAYTSQYAPLRPDLVPVLEEDAKASGLPLRTTEKTIERLQKRDVAVVDLMGASPGHNFGGDNLQAALFAATGTGAVVDGTIRDIGGILDIGSQIYYRESMPPAVSGVMVTGLNVPVRIGKAYVMPGDAVLGDREGVVFIPPHLVKEIVEKAEAGALKDEWMKQKLLSGKYKSSEIYASQLSPDLQKDFDEFVKSRSGK